MRQLIHGCHSRARQKVRIGPNDRYRMHVTSHATRRTHLDASRLAIDSKPRQAGTLCLPPRLRGDATGLTTTACQIMNTPPSPIRGLLSPSPSRPLGLCDPRIRFSHLLGDAEISVSCASMAEDAPNRWFTFCVEGQPQDVRAYLETEKHGQYLVSLMSQSGSIQAGYPEFVCRMCP